MDTNTEPARSIGALAAKMAKVMGAVERVPKTGRNDFHKYDYATEADIVAVVRKAMAEQGVMLIPAVSRFERLELTKGNGKTTTLTTVYMNFRWVDGGSGESLDVPWVGQGVDGEDKGVYKAITGAEKYILLKTFLIPTGDDPEKDDERSDRQSRAAHPPQKPAGFDQWQDDITAAADSGLDALRKAWQESKPEYRVYAGQELINALKLRAEAVKPAGAAA
jgi:hypothetical protein